MHTQRITRVLLAGMLLAWVTVAVNASAQANAQTHPPRNAQARNAAETNPSCQRIVQECQKLGYIVGQWKKDNGLWKDCFDPVVKGSTPTRDGRPVNVPVDASDIQNCRAAMHK